MSWVVINHNLRGGILSGSPKKRNRQRPNSSVPHMSSAASRTGVKSKTMQQQQRESLALPAAGGSRGGRGRSRSVGTRRRTVGSNGDKEVGSHLHRRVPRALSTPPIAVNCSLEDEISLSSLDCAWAKFGEARVLTQQNCFQEAWMALMEAKGLIDKAAEARSLLCATRHRRALLQLGQELNTATQLWLLRETPPRERGLLNNTAMFKDSATTPMAHAHQRQLPSADLDTDVKNKEVGVPLLNPDAASNNTSPYHGQQCHAEINISVDVCNSESHVSLNGEHVDSGSAAVKCRIMPPPASCCWVSRSRDMWNFSGLRSVPSSATSPSIHVVSDTTRPKFSDGIVVPPTRKWARHATFHQPPGILYSSPDAHDAMSSSQQQQKLNVDCELHRSRSPMHAMSPVRGDMLRQDTTLGYAVGYHDKKDTIETITLISSLPSPSSSTYSSSSRSSPPPPQEQRREKNTGRNSNRSATLAIGPPPNSILDLGEPVLVPLYAFEVVKPTPMNCDSPRGSCCVTSRPYPAHPPMSRPSTANGGGPACVASSEPLFGSTSHSPHETTLLGSSARVRNSSKPLTYISLYNFWKGKVIEKGSSYAYMQLEDSRNDDTVRNSHDTLKVGHFHSQHCQQQQKQPWDDGKVKGQESGWNADKAYPTPFNIYTPEGENIGRDSFTKERNCSFDEDVLSGPNMRQSVDDCLHRCFDGVESYQEARELHQRMVQRLLIEREEEEEENRIHQRDHCSHAVQLLGKLEEAYHDWLVDHLGIKRRQRVGAFDRRKQVSPSTISVTTAEDNPLDKSSEMGNGFSGNCSTEWMDGAPLSAYLSTSFLGLEEVLAFGSSAARAVTTSSVAQPEEDEGIMPSTRDVLSAPVPLDTAGVLRNRAVESGACDNGISSVDACASISTSAINGVSPLGQAKEMDQPRWKKEEGIIKAIATQRRSGGRALLFVRE